MTQLLEPDRVADDDAATNRRAGRRLSDRDRRILALAIPALGSLAVEPLYVLVDTAIIGRLGTVPLGGLALASACLTTILWAFTFLSYGTTAQVAFLRGRREDRGAAEVAVQGLWLCVVLGVPLAAFFGFGARPLASLLGGNDAVIEAAATYLRVAALGVPAILIAYVGQGYLRGREDTRTPFVVLGIANAINVVLDLILVYGADWGLEGSATGTVVAQWLAAIWFLALIRRHAKVAGTDHRARWTQMRRLVVIGRHLFVRTAVLLATLAFSTAVASRVDPTTLGGHQIALQIATFLALAVDGLAIPAQALVGTTLGAGDINEAKAISSRLLRWGAGVGVALAVIVMSTAFVVPHLFSGDAEVREAATVALLVVGAMQLPASMAFVLDGVLMGASDFRFLQWSGIAAACAFLPFAAAAITWPSLGILTIWLGLATWMVVRSLTNLARFRDERWTQVALT